MQDAIIEHTKFLTHFVKAKENCTMPITIAFGDSLIDSPRKELKTIQDSLNFSLPGSSPNDMTEMTISLSPFLKLCNVKHIVTGYLSDDAIEFLNTVRKLFPDAHIIVCMADNGLEKWVVDTDAVGISFKGMGGFFGLFPKIKYESASKTNFSSSGIYEFDTLIDRAKHAKKGSIVS